MKLNEALKHLTRKNPQSQTADPRKSEELVVGGRRAGENDNPYLSARRTWNHILGDMVSARQSMQLLGVAGVLVGLAGVGGTIYVGSQSKFIPYVIERDSIGQQRAIGPIERAPTDDPRVVQTAVADFIENARTVTPDVALQRKFVYAVYSKLAPLDPATAKMNDYLNGSEEASPFKRAASEGVSVEILSVLQQTKETWQVEWMETIRDRQGALKSQPYRMRALVTVYSVAPTPETTDAQLRMNPGGNFVRDFSWSKQL